MGVLECNKVRRTGLVPSAVVAMEKMNPSTAGRGGLCLGKAGNSFSRQLYPIHASCGERRGDGL